LLADADLGVFDKVVVYKLDRLARNLRLLLEIEDKLKKSGVFLYSVRESIDTSTSIGKVVFQVLGLASEWERDAIIERTRNGRIQRYKEGRWAGGKPPYGYSYDKDTKKLIINETEAKIVKRIFKEYKSGKSLRAIANALNEERIAPRSKKGTAWRATALRNVLINPVYKGMLVVNRNMHISDIAKVDMSKAIVISVPQIVSDKDWDIAQKRLAGNKSIRPMQEKGWLLQGLIKCGLCGMSYRTDRIHNRRYYQCRGKLKGSHLDGSPRCPSKDLRADCIEQKVRQRIEEIIDDPNKLGPLLKDTVETLKSREEELQAIMMPIDKQLAQIAKKKAKLADDWVKTNMDADKYKELQQALNQEEARLKLIRNEIDPAQIEELESTRKKLRLWQSQLKSMAWNTENEDGSMVRLVDEPHKMVLKIAKLHDASLTKTMGVPATEREWLDELQVRLTAFEDRMEVNAVFPIAPIDYQKCHSTY
jgi:site-specific DNA recombinase